MPRHLSSLPTSQLRDFSRRISAPCAPRAASVTSSVEIGAALAAWLGDGLGDGDENEPLPPPIPATIATVFALLRNLVVSRLLFAVARLVTFDRTTEYNSFV